MPQSNDIYSKDGYQLLGRKTFWVFLWQRSGYPALFLLLSIILLVFQRLANGSLKDLLSIIVLASFGIVVLAAIISWLAAWLQYTHYRFALKDDSLEISQGIFQIKQIAIPYHQIQNVNIERTIIDQMLGTSKLIIVTAGHDNPLTAADESEGILSPIDVVLAQKLQEELLKRAANQRVTVENK